MSYETGRCSHCGRRLKPYRPPTKDVPLYLGRDDFCSRSCLEAHLGIRPREGLKTK